MAVERHKIVVLASGSGTLLQAILDAQHNSAARYEVVAVVTDVPCQANERATNAGITTEIISFDRTQSRTQWDTQLAQAVAAYTPALVVSAGFMKILGAAFLEQFGGRTINTHPALLPSFPGAHGVRDALAYGVKVTGSTVHFVDAGVDTGPIIAQEPVRILPGEEEADLHERIKRVERELIVTVLNSAEVDEQSGEVTFTNE
ncbi:MAG: phosphoribosylglycinamide formyltransferase [Corynebacterium sp.]|nr:phosphoribosylglycinamide formyltransferase [Corynebacterium sp.]